VDLIKYALKFRKTFFVLAILILFLGTGAIATMPKDVFPIVDIPVVTIIWTYTGLSAKEMEQRVTTYSEFVLGNNVNGIRHIESQTLQGVSVEKVYFQPGVSIDLAISQTVAVMNAVRAVLPPGINPPIVVRYSASSVPVIQLALSSSTASEQQLYDFGQYRLRTSIATVPGSTIPSPYGGRQRQIMIDLDQHALQSTGLTAADIVNALTAQNLTVPSGLAKLGDTQYVVRLNSVPDAIEAMNAIPVKVVNGVPILMRDVAYVRDGYQVQQNIVRTNGVRSALLTILKNGDASTLSVVNNVKSLLPGIRAAAPKDIQIAPLFDQSVFVSGAISDVLREGLIAAALTGLMILLFLGSWRSTLIVLVSIPLSILSSLIVLDALGETINIMTLGGMALAVGILVDDATVAIENTYRLLEEGREFKHAVVEGAAGIAKPALISTLAICCAFVSVVFLTDAAKYLFTPQAIAVVFAMLASYILSRTLIPILIDTLVKSEHQRELTRRGHHADETRPPGVFWRCHRAFEAQFSRFHVGYAALLRRIVERPVKLLLTAGGALAVTAIMFLFVGSDYFPQIDAGQLQLHVRGPSGLRIEETERLFQEVEDTIRTVVPPKDLGLLIDNIGLPANNYNLAFSDGSTVGLNDGQILVSLNPGHASTFGYMRKLRTVLRERFPDSIFYFQPADIITQILNFGLPAPVDIRVLGKDRDVDLKIAQSLVDEVKGVRGAVDVHLQQIVDAPEFFVDVDRIRAAKLGLTEASIASDLGTSLSSSYQTTPNFWSDPSTGVPYQVAVQTPEYRVSSMSDLVNMPLLASGSPGTRTPVGLLSNVATLSRHGSQTVATHSDTQPSFDIYANIQDRDLGSIEADLRPIVARAQAQLPPGNSIVLRGQIESMNASFQRIGFGLIAAMVFVYLLMVVNFQTWGEPFVVLAALPMALCGVLASLFITGTTLSIPSLFGAIMSVGIASANSILLVTFAKEHREQTRCSAKEAAIAAGETRLRPVLMTAGAMFVGLLPMALGLGDGSEQNAALARAVMGGVLVGTCSTLLLVPLLYSLFRRSADGQPIEDYI
jgi:multidrug efflux pump subunit AcrB